MIQFIKAWFSRLFGSGSEAVKDAKGGKYPQFTRLVLLLGISGMLLIGLSECRLGSEPQKSDAPADPYSVSADEYAQKLEKRLLEALEQMDGVGKVQVLVTMEDTGENVYATEERETSDNRSSYGENGRELQSIQTSRSGEQSYLLVENQNGKRQALLVSRSEPQVKGVIVICEGAGQPSVCEAVTEAVKTALHISANRVYVAKAKPSAPK
jgi:stage III sporulation protein AG